MTPQEKKEIDFVLKTAKEIVLFCITLGIMFTIVVNVFL
jgi:hypothetical protein